MKNNSWMERMLGMMHMDLHTPDNLINYETKFDPDKMASILAASKFKYVCIFGKDCNGYSFFNTKIGKKHPGYKRDFMGEMLQSCHKKKVKVFTYYSVNIDLFACDTHPEWEMFGDERIPKEKRDEYGMVCLVTPYAEYALQQLEEIAHYSVDGLFLDMVGFYLRCKCTYCQRSYKEKTGNDIPKDNETNRKIVFPYYEWQLSVVDQFMNEVHKRTKSINPNLLIGINSHFGPTEKFTSNRFQKDDYLICETDPAVIRGDYFNLGIRSLYYKSDPQRRPFMLITTLFHCLWQDFTVRSEPQLRYDMSSIFSFQSLPCMGDQIRPEGYIEPAAYKIAKKVNEFINDRDKWIGGDRIAQVSLYDGSRYYNYPKNIEGDLIGVYRILSEEHYAFDISHRANLDSLFKYKLILLENAEQLNEEEIQAIRDYVKNGGNIITFGDISRINNNTLEYENFKLSDVLGINFEKESKFSVSYIDRISSKISKDVPDMPILARRKAQLVKANDSTNILARLTFPVVERIGSSHYPPQVFTDYPAIVMNKYGKGKSIYFAMAAAKAFADESYFALSELIENCIDVLIGRRLFYTNLPKRCDILTYRQGNNIRMHIVHPNMSKPADRGRNTLHVVIDEDYPLHGVWVKIDKNFCQPKKAYLEPCHKKIPIKRDKSDSILNIPSFETHAVVDMVVR